MAPRAGSTDCPSSALVRRTSMPRIGGAASRGIRDASSTADDAELENARARLRACLDRRGVGNQRGTSASGRCGPRHLAHDACGEDEAPRNLGAPRAASRPGRAARGAAPAVPHVGPCCGDRPGPPSPRPRIIRALRGGEDAAAPRSQVGEPRPTHARAPPPTWTWAARTTKTPPGCRLRTRTHSDTACTRRQPWRRAACASTPVCRSIRSNATVRSRSVPCRTPFTNPDAHFGTECRASSLLADVSGDAFLKEEPC